MDRWRTRQMWTCVLLESSCYLCQQAAVFGLLPPCCLDCHLSCRRCCYPPWEFGISLCCATPAGIFGSPPHLLTCGWIWRSARGRPYGSRHRRRRVAECCQLGCMRASLTCALVSFRGRKPCKWHLRQSSPRRFIFSQMPRFASRRHPRHGHSCWAPLSQISFSRHHRQTTHSSCASPTRLFHTWAPTRHVSYRCLSLPVMMH